VFSSKTLNLMFSSQTGKNIKIIHLKSQNSVALPIYTSDLSHLAVVEEAQKKAHPTKVKLLKVAPKILL